MTDDTLRPFDLPAVRRKKLTVDFAGGNQSSDAGLLLLRQAQPKLGICGRLAAAMPDRRDPGRIRHDMFKMVMARVSAIACGYENAIDLDSLRHDPLMKVAVGRCPTSGAPLASQLTISRPENAPSRTEAAQLAGEMIKLQTGIQTARPIPRDRLGLSRCVEREGAACILEHRWRCRIHQGQPREAAGYRRPRILSAQLSAAAGRAARAF